MFFKKITKKIKLNKKNTLTFFSVLFFLVIILSILFFYKNNFRFEGENNLELHTFFKQNTEKNFDFRKEFFLHKAENLRKSGCIELEMFEEKKCNLRTQEASWCIKKGDFFTFPKCSLFDVTHIKKPEKVKAVYLSSYGASRTDKIDQLIYLVKNTEVNSVVIDVKEINGKVYFEIPTQNFDKIKPEFDVVLRNPKDLLEKLHSYGIYVIGRVVLFKDKNLVKKRPDLAVKKSDKKTVWQDYKKKTWVDTGSKEVWDYNLEISRQTYLMGFDEINLDYVRFPSDGPMSDIYFPFSQEKLDSDKKWGRAKIMDEFYNYFTSKLREEFPDIEISASIFGQVALNYNDVSIGQILESAILYFDEVSPMSYPSHYHKNFGNFSDGPDNHPFEVIDLTLKFANRKIDNLNREIENAQKNNEKIKIRENFYANIQVDKVEKIDYKKIRLWLQAFNCVWCSKNYKVYNKEEIWEQVDAVYKNHGNSWMLWNASSRYENDFFRK